MWHDVLDYGIVQRCNVSYLKTLPFVYQKIFWSHRLKMALGRKPKHVAVIIFKLYFKYIFSAIKVVLDCQVVYILYAFKTQTGYDTWKSYNASPHKTSSGKHLPAFGRSAGSVQCIEGGMEGLRLNLFTGDQEVILRLQWTTCQWRTGVYEYSDEWVTNSNK